jgi:hypothetical protein
MHARARPYSLRGLPSLESGKALTAGHHREGNRTRIQNAAIAQIMKDAAKIARTGNSAGSARGRQRDA